MICDCCAAGHPVHAPPRTPQRTNSALSRPLLRYHGSKWRLADWIVSHLPRHRTYVEPFGGAASVLLRKPRSHTEVYNDLDSELVNLFRVARDQGEALRRALELTPFARDEFALSYAASDDPLERARRTVARSFMGFGSNALHQTTGFRSRSRRSGTSPAADWRGYPQALEAIIRRLQGVVIEHRDAFEVMGAQDAEDTLFYVDPPYVPETRDAGGDYRHELTVADHERLAEALHALAGPVVLSGYASALYDRLYSGWRRVERRTHADGARERVEVLWLSPRCPAPGLFEWHPN